MQFSSHTINDTLNSHCFFWEIYSSNAKCLTRQKPIWHFDSHKNYEDGELTSAYNPQGKHSARELPMPGYPNEENAVSYFIKLYPSTKMKYILTEMKYLLTEMKYLLPKMKYILTKMKYLLTKMKYLSGENSVLTLSSFPGTSFLLSRLSIQCCRKESLAW